VKRGLILIVLLALTISLVAAVGCGKKTTTITTPDGEVTVTEQSGSGDSGKVTVKDESGNDSTYEWSDKAPSEAELGAPIYPGATYVPGTGGSGGVSSTEGNTAVAGADFTTPDSLSKVVDWYTGKLGAPLSSSDNEYMWMPNSNIDTGNFVTVSVKQDGGKVTISIASVGTAK
jgi:hypothetical protein